MRGDEVNGKRREGGEQIWTGNLRMLHEDEEEEETGKTGEWVFLYRNTNIPSLNFYMALMVMQIWTRKPDSYSTQDL